MKKNYEKKKKKKLGPFQDHKKHKREITILKKLGPFQDHKKHKREITILTIKCFKESK